jgi:hypothetical protein
MVKTSEVYAATRIMKGLQSRPSRHIRCNNKFRIKSFLGIEDYRERRSFSWNRPNSATLALAF